eukprot:504244-Amphidinium_carterae.1
MLEVGQSRFRVELGDLPEDIALMSGERRCRSAIHDANAEDTNLEVVLEPDSKWVLNILDQSSSQWGGRCFLSYSSELRFLHIPDMFHRRSNDCKNALSQVGLNSLRLTATICLNFRMGPWQESAHHQKMTAILSDYCRTRTIADPLFMLQYEALRLSLDMNAGVVPADLGSSEHMWLVFRWLESNPLLQKRGSMLKTGRWHGFASQAPQLREVSACLVFIGVLLALDSGLM